MSSRVTKIKFVPQINCVRCGRKLSSKQQGLCTKCLLEIAGVKPDDLYDLGCGDDRYMLPRGDVLKALRRVYDHALTGR